MYAESRPNQAQASAKFTSLSPVWEGMERLRPSCFEKLPSGTPYSFLFTPQVESKAEALQQLKQHMERLNLLQKKILQTHHRKK